MPFGRLGSGSAQKCHFRQFWRVFEDFLGCPIKSSRESGMGLKSLGGTYQNVSKVTTLSGLDGMVQIQSQKSHSVPKPHRMPNLMKMSTFRSILKSLDKIPSQNSQSPKK